MYPRFAAKSSPYLKPWTASMNAGSLFHISHGLASSTSVESVDCLDLRLLASSRPRLGVRVTRVILSGTGTDAVVSTTGHLISGATVGCSCSTSRQACHGSLLRYQSLALYSVQTRTSIYCGKSTMYTQVATFRASLARLWRPCRTCWTKVNRARTVSSPSTRHVYFQSDT